MPPQDVPPVRLESEVAVEGPDFIPKDCLRLNSPYMLQPKDKKELSPTEKIEPALTLFDPFHGFDTLKRLLGQNDSCERLQDDDVFTQWLALTHSQLRLQISGGTKNDRTLAALFVVGHLQGLQTSRSSKPSAVLKGWMYQLLQQRPDMMQEFFNTHTEEPGPIYMPPYLLQTRMMWTFLRRSAKRDKGGITYCVLDGLDECDTKSRSLVLELLDRTLPYEGCPEEAPTLKFLITARTPLGSADYGKIDLDTRVGSDSSPSVVQPSTTGHLDSLSQQYNGVGFVALRMLAAYFSPPTTEQFLSTFLESHRPAVLAFLHSHPAELLVSPERIEFIDSDAWQALSKAELADDNHNKLARKSLQVISTGLARIDMIDLESDDESVWMSQVSADLKYAVIHWADHVKWFKETPQDLMDLILATFCPHPEVVEKLYIMFMTWQYGITGFPDRRKYYTTPLHIFTLVDLFELLHETCADWLYEKYEKSKDARGLVPLDLAILYNYLDVAHMLQASFPITTNRQYICATASIPLLADMIFHNPGKDVPDLKEDEIKMMLWQACYTGNRELLDSAINFILGKTSGTFLPWNYTFCVENVIDSGAHELLLPVLRITNMRDTARHVIEYAATQHEPRMLEEILAYHVVRDMIRAKQINLSKALELALVCRNSRMTELLLSDDNMDPPDSIKPRPLEWAVKYPNIHTLMLFLAQRNFRFDKGTIEEGVALNLMLHNAGKESGVGIDSLRKLLKRGAKMRYEDFGMTAIHVAAELGGILVMETLLKNMTEDIKDDINRICSRTHRSQGREGKTALAIAVMTGRFGTVKCLLENGADVNVVDTDGKSALQLAREAGWGNFVEGLFRDHEEGLGDDESRAENREEDEGNAKA